MYGSHRNNRNNDIGMIIAWKRIVQMGHFFGRMKTELGEGINKNNGKGGWMGSAVGVQVVDC